MPFCYSFPMSWDRFPSYTIPLNIAPSIIDNFCLPFLMSMLDKAQIGIIRKTASSMNCMVAQRHFLTWSPLRNTVLIPMKSTPSLPFSALPR